MSRPNEWRYSARPARVFFFDARAAVGFVIFMLHWSLTTFEIAVGFFLVFGLIDRMGFTVAVTWRWLRSRLVGGIRPSVSWWHRPWGNV